MVDKKGLTLVEVLIVMAILIVMITIAIGVLNPIALTDRGNDARRKKDLGRIRVAFEEYNNDRGCYPTQNFVDTMLMDRDNCGTDVFAPWLSQWICDPRDIPYQIVVQEKDCPGWFRVLTNLSNKTDTDVPKGWYSGPIGTKIGPYSRDEVNYGVSSTNISWYDNMLDKSCDPLSCHRRDGTTCNTGGTGCVGPNCYMDHNCSDTCQVDCCGTGCVD